MSINKIIVDTTTGAQAATSINEVIDIVESTEGGSTTEVLTKTGNGDYEWGWAPALEGATGPQGPQGDTGATGQTGATGADNVNGWESGSGNDSLMSPAALTTQFDVPNAPGIRSIAIGGSSLANGTDSIAIGAITRTDFADSLAMMISARTFGQRSIAIGNNTINDGTNSTSIGYRARAIGNGGINIGGGTFAITYAVTDGIAIGNEARQVGDAVGHVCLGAFSEVHEPYGIALGDSSKVDSDSNEGIAIGYEATSSASKAVAIGSGVTASVADYTTTKNLQLTNYAALDFADDTAAANGGVPLGGIYHTAGSLKIRIV
jgi:hypothetical protein